MSQMETKVTWKIRKCIEVSIPTESQNEMRRKVLWGNGRLCFRVVAGCRWDMPKKRMDSLREVKVWTTGRERGIRRLSRNEDATIYSATQNNYNGVHL